MDNMLFWKILKSIFGSESEDFKRKIDYMLSWDYSIINNDNMIKMLKFVSKTFEDTKMMPLYQVFIAQFPETSWYFESIEGVTDSDSLAQLIAMFEKNCMNRIASMKLQEYSQQVAVKGLTLEGLNELKKYAVVENDKTKHLTPEEEYNKKIVNITSMKTGISEIDELISIPKGAVVTIAGFTGSFKCVAGDTLVNTTKGLMRISDIYNQNIDDRNLKVLSEIGYKRIEQTHYDGLKPTIKVFVGGRLVETSPVHRFRIIRNNECQWCCAKDLRVSDYVLLKKEFIRKDYQENKNISFKQFKNIFKNLTSSNDIDNEFCSKKWAVLPYSKDVYKNRTKIETKKAYDLGLALDLNNETAELPKEIFTANPEAQSAFLNAVFSRNGSLTISDNHIGINSCNFYLLNDLATILFSFETATRIINYDNNKWRLTTDTYYNKYDLIRACSFYDSAQRKINILDIQNKEKDEKINLLEDEADLAKKRQKTEEEIRYSLVYQQITKIEINSNGNFLYDLTVEGHPSYIANGCVTHNTTTTANIVYRNVYENGYNFAYISLEVTKFDLLLNLWCLHTLNKKFDPKKRIPTKAARDGKLTEEQRRYLFDVIVPDFTENSKGKLKIIDESCFKMFSEGEIIQKLEEIDDEFDKKLDGVVLDHANLCKFYSSSENTTESTNRYVSLFRRLSNAFRYDPETNEMRGLTTILLAQTNRTGWHEAAKKNGEYDLTALAEANELERCSSVILTVFHDKNSTVANELKVCLLKNRYGMAHPEPIITDVYPEYYYVGDRLDGYTYQSGCVSMNDLYNNRPNSFGFSNADSFYDSDEFF